MLYKSEQSGALDEYSQYSRGFRTIDHSNNRYSRPAAQIGTEDSIDLRLPCRYLVSISSLISYQLIKSLMFSIVPALPASYALYQLQPPLVMAQILLVCFISFHYTLLSTYLVSRLVNTTPTYLWTAVEASVGLMCACFPVIGPMFSLVHEKLRSRTSSHRSYSRGSKNSNSRPWQLVNNAKDASEHDTLPLHNLPAHQPSFDAMSKHGDVTLDTR